MATNPHTTLLQVPVLTGAPEALVCRRELRNKYCTNRDIKTWSAYFLLKSLSTSSKLKKWLSQNQMLQEVLQCTEGTLRVTINRLRQLGAITVCASRNLTLCSYQKAADILQIPYEGTTTIAYDYTRQKGQQLFAYLIRLNEIENAKERQLEGLIYHVNKNPELSTVLQDAMARQGINPEEATAEEFQKWLLKMQCRTFAEGSAIYDEIHARRADTNRSVNGIQECHKYRCKTSVSYMKKVLKKYGLATITKTIVESTIRSRKFIYIGQRTEEAYKYKASRKSTLLVLCDDISPINLKAA